MDCQFQDLPLLSHDWNIAPALPAVLPAVLPAAVLPTAVPSRPAPSGLDSRKGSVSTIGMELERQLGIQDANPLGVRPLSVLRHPDGASDPQLNHQQEFSTLHAINYCGY